MKGNTYLICIDGISITVTKKNIKNIYLRIKKEDGAVCLSVPHRMSDAEIRAFVREKMAWIEAYRKKYLEAGKQRAGKPPLSGAELEKRKQLLKSEVVNLVKKWEPVMGVSVSGITIRQMKTRWGSCNVKTHHININLALADKPPECLEYVVVHEMTHILEASHNQTFWGYMTQFYPNWKEVRKALNEETAM